METIDISSRWLEPGEPVSILIVYDSDDGDAKWTAGEFKKHICEGTDPETSRATTFRTEPVDSYSRLVKVFDGISDDSFNCLLVIAHGLCKEQEKTTIRFGPKSEPRSRVNIAEFSSALQNRVQNKLCLFGVCMSGGDAMTMGVYAMEGAIMCIAPKSTAEILSAETISGFGGIIVDACRDRDSVIGWERLHGILDTPDIVWPELRDKLYIYPGP